MITDQSFQHIALKQEAGVLQATLHTGGDSLIWSGRAGYELSQLFSMLRTRDDVKVLILIGSGSDFCAQAKPFRFDKVRWRDVWAGEQAMLGTLMDLDIVMISALNGPLYFHPEIPLMADIVLGVPDVEIAELGHFPLGMVAGDGAQLIFDMLLGPSRSRYFYLTEQRLGAAEALELGLVHELVAPENLRTRAMVLATAISAKPRAVVQATKRSLAARRRWQFADGLRAGMSVEGLGMYATGLAVPEVADR